MADEAYGEAMMGVLAKKLREMREAAMKEGFTRAEALELCKEVIRAGMTNNKTE